MKKILSVLLIVALLCSISVMLFACTSGELKKLTYTDENGQEQSITIKKTADSDKVTASILALAGKEVDTTAYNNLVATATTSGVCTGSQKGAAFNLTFDANAKIGLAFPTEEPADYKLSTILGASKVYAGIEFTGRLPKDVEDDEVPNFCDVVEYNENAKLYLDESKLYTQLNLSDNMIAKIPALLTYFIDIQGMNKKTAFIDVSGIFAALDLMVPEKDIAAYYKAAKGTKASYAKIVEKAAAQDAKEGETVEPVISYANVKKIVEACGIKITKTKGSKVTFAATVNKEAITNIIRTFAKNEAEAEKAIADVDFEGKIDIEVEIDAKTMLDIKVTVTSSDIFNGSFADIPASEDVQISRQEFSASVAISTTEACPTISAEDKAAAQEFQLNFDITQLLNYLKA